MHEIAWRITIFTENEERLKKMSDVPVAQKAQLEEDFDVSINTLDDKFAIYVKLLGSRRPLQ